MSDNLYASPEAVSTLPNPPRRFLMTIIKLLSLAAVIVVLIGIFLPVNRGREAARRTQCKNNLKQIGFALHNYYDFYGTLPPAYTVDSSGKPLHSWRTLILPWLEQQSLYNTIDLSKPWNDQVNAEALKTVPTVYRCPSAVLPPGYTSYLAVVGTNCCFQPTESRALSEIADGTSNTLMVIEVALENAVPWMTPQDADEQMVLSFLKSGKLAHTGGTQAALADGSVRFLSQNLEPKTLQALMTIAGDDVVGEF